VENDVHILGVSSLAASHKTLVPQVISELKKLGGKIFLLLQRVIPHQDYQFLYDAGVAAIFGREHRFQKQQNRFFRFCLRLINEYETTWFLFNNVSELI